MQLFKIGCVHTPIWMTVVGNLDLVSKPYMNATHWHIKSSFQLTKQKLNQISYPYKLFFCNEIQLIGILHRAPPKYVTKLRDPDGVRECCRSVRSTCSQSLNAGSPLWRSLISFQFNDWNRHPFSTICKNEKVQLPYASEIYYMLVHYPRLQASHYFFEQFESKRHRVGHATTATR